MCDECKIEEVESQEQIEITEEQLMEMLQSSNGNKQELTYFRDPIEFDDEEMNHMVNSDEFIQGQADATYWCGFYTQLMNAGIPVELVIELICTQQQNKANETIQRMNVDMNIEMSKNQVIVAEKNQL